MLTQIDIANLATIQKLHLELFAGTTVITGETGAGKSILIDAIELALGSRATGDIGSRGAG
jgi:DNA repair protein RecN (Recombination protein N)